MNTSSELHLRRKQRQRHKIKLTSSGRLRLCVFRSNKHIYAQIIDDVKATTLVCASSVEAALKEKAAKGSNKDAATYIGQIIAERAVKSGIKEVVFDRSGYLYHGRVKSLADSARANGLSF
jgi:large subunit ribosomal protein L18